MESDDPVAAAAGASAVPVAFAKRRNRSNIRKRDSESQNQEDDSSVVHKVKHTKGEGSSLSFTTRKDEKEDLTLKFESDRALKDTAKADATRMLETETEFDRDARSRREAVLKQAVEGAKDDGKYRGMNSYIDYRAGFRREHTVASEKGTGTHGPLRASMYARTTLRVDYQPDLCKDYKETGFCSYGDSCKFLHDRGDYKSGWELEREFDEEQKRKAAEKMRRAMKEANSDDGSGAEEDEDDDGLPFACYICRRSWVECDDPVVTRCKHYFCQKCALKRNAKTGKCAVCEEPTLGIFNVANDILKKAAKMRQRPPKQRPEEG